MKNLVIVLGILIVMGLVISGCSKKDATPTPTPTPEESPTATPEMSPEESPSPTPSPSNLDLSKDDLDQLDADLADLEFDDLGGLEE